MVKPPATVWGWSKAVGLPLGISKPMTVAEVKKLRAAMPAKRQEGTEA